ncbi:MAG: 16S rRNA (cytosine(1402)-N(4))-methyltransferase RsmH [Sphingobacteriales bacterium]|nr:MAG: 16S rRNA (cytosine(1402)-N(4))-methyltransferase RsmH [Sphingobacteriales bacterium]
MTENHLYHQPVLLQEAVEALQIAADGIYVDVTFGGGGHSKAILEQLGNFGRLIAFDQDQDALQNTFTDSRFTFVPHNFKHLKRFLRLYNINQVDGILADLGVSWHQFNTPNRGFSIRFGSEALDMRMSADNELSAYEVLNKYPAENLAQIFKDFGDIPNARKLANAIVQERKKRPVDTIQQLLVLAEPLCIGKPQQYLARVFQAVRMEVNKEVAALQALLEQSVEALRTGGLLVVISYHSVEDRMVKNFIKTGSIDGIVQRDLYGNSNIPLVGVNKKIITPTENEIRQNPKASSAKMRVARKK